MATNEQLYGALLQGPLTTQTTSTVGVSQQWAGRTTLASGSASVTVNTSVIDSDSLILLGTEASSVGVAGIQSAGAVVVNSVVENTSFALARQSGTAAPWDEVVSYLIVKTK